jgi:ribonuclease BN (tRNA processing enzyme)
MIDFAIRFLGVGNSHALALGSSAVVLEVGDEPWLLVDCGPETLANYLATYERLPDALFITHAHLDHIGGLENLFYRLATADPRPQLPRLYVPVALLPILQRRLADYPNLLAEGGWNFWDAFQLVPVSDRFWHRELRFSVFPVRHHEHMAAFGLALEGRFLYTGDTRPIPEILNRYGSRGERIFHDCSAVPNPSHTAIEDIPREYKEEQWRRMVFYHYDSEATARLIERHGYRAARRGERFPLGYPYVEAQPADTGAELRRFPGTAAP